MNKVQEGTSGQQCVYIAILNLIPSPNPKLFKIIKPNPNLYPKLDLMRNWVDLVGVDLICEINLVRIDHLMSVDLVGVDSVEDTNVGVLLQRQNGSPNDVTANRQYYGRKWWQTRVAFARAFVSSVQHYNDACNTLLITWQRTFFFVPIWVSERSSNEVQITHERSCCASMTNSYVRIMLRGASYARLFAPWTTIFELPS